MQDITQTPATVASVRDALRDAGWNSWEYVVYPASGAVAVGIGEVDQGRIALLQAAGGMLNAIRSGKLSVVGLDPDDSTDATHALIRGGLLHVA